MKKNVNTYYFNQHLKKSIKHNHKSANLPSKNPSRIIKFKHSSIKKASPPIEEISPNYTSPSIEIDDEDIVIEVAENSLPIQIDENRKYVITFDQSMASSMQEAQFPDAAEPDSPDAPETPQLATIPLILQPLKSNRDVQMDAVDIPSNLGTCLAKLKLVDNQLIVELQSSVVESVQNLINYHRNVNNAEIEMHELVLQEDLLIPMEDTMQTFEIVMLEKTEEIREQIMQTGDEYVEPMQIRLEEDLPMNSDVIYGIIMYPQCNMNNFTFLTGFDVGNFSANNISMDNSNFKKSNLNKKNMIKNHKNKIELLERKNKLKKSIDILNKKLIKLLL